MTQLLRYLHALVPAGATINAAGVGFLALAVYHLCAGDQVGAVQSFGLALVAMHLRGGAAPPLPPAAPALPAA